MCVLSDCASRGHLCDSTAFLFFSAFANFKEVSADADALVPQSTPNRPSLCIQLDAECDQQVMIVGRLLITLDHASTTCCQQQTDDNRLFVAFGVGAVANFSKSSLGQIQTDVPYFDDPNFFKALCTKSVGYAETSSIHAAVSIQYRRVTDRQTQAHS